MSDTDQQTRVPVSRAKLKRPKAGWGSAVRMLVRRVHFLAGIVVAPFILVLCLTGLIYVFSPQIHDNLYEAQLHVTNQVGAPHPVSEQINAALAAHPEAKPQSVITPSGPDRTTQVVLSAPGARDAAEARTVFVDPYTNYINGELTTVGNRLPANTWLRKLHSNLHLGEPGRVYAELAACWLPIITIAGLVLWIAPPRRRKDVSMHEVLVPSTRGVEERRERLRRLHGPLGLWLTVGLVVVGVTGLVMSQYAGGRADQAIDPIRLRAPTLVAAPVQVPANTEPVGVDQALDVARAQRLSGELLVTVPSGAGQVFTVAERSQGLPIQRDSIAIDPYTAKVTERIGWSDYSLAAKLTTLGAEFHTGTLFGLANQILIAVLTSGLFVLIVLGYRMWWMRNPYQGRWESLPPPVWRLLPRPALILLVLGGAGLAWLMPVFGISLVAFLVVDSVITRIQRRRQPTHRLVRL